jgi:hypothetical protein
MTMIAYAFLQYRRLKTAGREKESTGRCLNRHCPPCVRPSSNSSLGHHRNDAHIAENRSAKGCGVSKSAKVVLVLHGNGRNLAMPRRGLLIGIRDS